MKGMMELVGFVDKLQIHNCKLPCFHSIPNTLQVIVGGPREACGGLSARKGG